jgi:hypothetical protein
MFQREDIAARNLRQGKGGTKSEDSLLQFECGRQGAINLTNNHRFCLLLGVLIAGAFAARAQTTALPVAVNDPGMVTTGQQLTPAGFQAVLQGEVYGVALDSVHQTLWALSTGCEVSEIDWKTNRIVKKFSFRDPKRYTLPGIQGIRYFPDRGLTIVACTYQASEKEESQTGVKIITIENGSSTVTDLTESLAIKRLPVLDAGYDSPGPGYVGAPELGIAKGRPVILLPLTFHRDVAVIDLATKHLVGEIETGVAPFRVAADPTRPVAFVSNVGGRLAKATDKSLPIGLAEDAERVVVDDRGIVMHGSVAEIDLDSLRVIGTAESPSHPTSLSLDPVRNALYSVNGNADSVSRWATNGFQLAATIPLPIAGKGISGITPTASVLTRNGQRLYVACAGLNAIAIIDLASQKILGFIPTGWFPNDLQLSADEKTLVVSNQYGVGAGSVDKSRKRKFSAYRGSVNIIPVPADSDLDAFTSMVARNSFIDAISLKAGRVESIRQSQDVESESAFRHIDHVVYIIKENRTYDQILGDLGVGDSDGSLVLFGSRVTPNHHKLAREFVVLDNFYVNGNPSNVGHQWITQGNATDWIEWDAYRGRAHPFAGTDPVAGSSGGFLWNRAQEAGKTVRIFGEYSGRLTETDVQNAPIFLERWKDGADFSRDFSTVPPNTAMRGIVDPRYPPFTGTVPDVVRAKIFLGALREWTEKGSMPNLIIMHLPNDHTLGTTPGAPTPSAAVADNDLALGQIVEGLTRSPFWKSMVVFVVEDDASAGVDHVDGNRTVALIAGPYIKRGYIDSTFYSQVSMVKTIEGILGLQELSFYTAITNDMRLCFTNEPDFRPFAAEMPAQSLFDLNPPLSALKGPARRAASDSMRMDFSSPDEAPAEPLARIVWHSVKGWNTPFPGVSRSLFTPLTDEDH